MREMISSPWSADRSRARAGTEWTGVQMPSKYAGHYAYTAYCPVVMSCLHTVVSVYHLLVDYYAYFVYVCMIATTMW